MARNNHGPLWNQDVVLAVGLAVAGMAVLQSKLFSSAAAMELPLLNWLAAWKLIAWWPVLLIVSGVVLWVWQIRANRRSKKRTRSVVQTGR